MIKIESGKTAQKAQKKGEEAGVQIPVKML